MAQITTNKDTLTIPEITGEHLIALIRGFESHPLRILTGERVMTTITHNGTGREEAVKNVAEEFVYYLLGGQDDGDLDYVIEACRELETIDRA